MIIALVSFFTTTKLSAQVPTNGLMARWSFDGGAQDGSGNAYDGVVSGATLTSDAFGVPNSAYAFNGVNGSIDIGSQVKPNFPFSILARVKGTGPVFSNDSINSAGNRYGVSLWVDPTNCYVYFFSGFATANTRYSRTTAGLAPLDDGHWHSVAVVCRSRTDVDFIVDGRVYTSIYDSGSGGDQVYSATGTGKIGAWFPDASYFSGSLDEVLVYSRGLSSNEVNLVNMANWTITQEPQDQQVPLGEDVSFSIAVDGPTTPAVAYQWFFNHAAIPGATNTTYTIQSVRFSDTGSYYVQISGPLGVVNSRVAQLSVLPFAIAVYVAVEMEFPSAVGRTYRIQYSTDLITWFDEVGETNIQGTGQLINRLFSTRATQAKYFRAVQN